MDDIRRKCNLIVNLSKFTSNKKKKYIYIYIYMLSGFVGQSTIKFVAKLCPRFNYIGSKKMYGVHNIF